MSQLDARELKTRADLADTTVSVIVAGILARRADELELLGRPEPGRPAHVSAYVPLGLASLVDAASATTGITRAELIASAIAVELS